RVRCEPGSGQGDRRARQVGYGRVHRNREQDVRNGWLIPALRVDEGPDRLRSAGDSEQLDDDRRAASAYLAVADRSRDRPAGPGVPTLAHSAVRDRTPRVELH